MTSTVNMNKDGAKFVVDALGSVGNNIGIGAAVGGIGAATAKVLAKTGLPAKTKVLGVAIGGAVGGVIHTGVVTVEKIITSGSHNSSTPSGSDTPPSPSSTFSANSPNEELFILDLDSPVGLLLSSILTLNLVSLLLVLILAFILLIKLLLSSNLELKWLDSKLTSYYSSKVKYIITKLTSIIQKTSVINIILVMIIIIISGMGSLYLLIKLIANFEAVVQSYLKSTGR
jgi:predicted PurR-regulated permease PerM